MFISGGLVPSFASLPLNNGVVQTSHALDSLLDTHTSESTYMRCQSQGSSARYFSNQCVKLVQNLRKRMNTLVLESDFQIQAEKFSKKLSGDAKARVSLLSKINLLATQAEETIKSAQNRDRIETKDDVSELMASVMKVQASLSSYEKLMLGPMVRASNP